MDFLIPFAVIGAVIAGVVMLTRRGQGQPEEPGIGTVRRLFYYGVGFIALLVMASGAQMVFTELLEAATTDVIVRQRSTQIAFGLAAMIVAGPVWLGVWLLAKRSLQEFAAEAGTIARKLYVYGVLTVAASVTAGTAISLLTQAVGGRDYSRASAAGVVVWGAVWAFHWRVESREGQPSENARTIRRLHVYSASAYGVVLLAVGVGTALAALLSAAYAALFTDALILRGGSTFDADQLRRGGAMALTGGLWWWWYWHRAARGDADSLLRQWVLYGLGIFGGAATIAGFATGFLNRVLAWAFDTGASSAAAALDFAPVAMAGAVSGTALWGYHAAAARQEAPSLRAASGQRTYRYLLAAAGLGLLTVGAALLVGVVVGLLSPGSTPFASRGVWWSDPLALGISTALVGAPLWLYHWSRLRALVSAGGQAETGALPRRVYLYGAGGIATLSSAGALIALIVTFLAAVLDNDLSWQVLQDAKWAIAVVTATGGVGAYHWWVLREDAARGTGAARIPAVVRKSVLVVSGGDAPALASALSQRLGYSVSAWQRTDEAPAELSSAGLDSLAAQVQSAPGERLLIVVSGDGIQVIPYGPA